MLVHGVSHNIGWYYMRGPISDDEMRTHLDSVTMLCANHESIFVVILADEGSFPNASQRQMIAENIKKHPVLSEKIRGMVFVVPQLGQIARGVLTAINWLARKQWDEAMVGAIPESADWLLARGASRDDVAQMVHDTQDLFQHQARSA